MRNLAGIEPQAEKLLKRMSDYLASRQQFTLKAESTLEAVLTSGQKLQYDSPATLMVSRPNRLRAHRKGDIVNQEFFYDGKTLTLYNPKENLYATTAAPPTLDEMLDFAREKLDIIAPAAELLYKNAAERMLKESSSGFVVGQSIVGGVKSPSRVSRRRSRLADLDRGRGQAVAAQIHAYHETGYRISTVHRVNQELGRSAEVDEFRVQFRATQRREEDRVSPADRRSREAEMSWLSNVFSY